MGKNINNSSKTNTENNNDTINMNTNNNNNNNIGDDLLDELSNIIYQSSPTPLPDGMDSIPQREFGSYSSSTNKHQMNNSTNIMDEQHDDIINVTANTSTKNRKRKGVSSSKVSYYHS